jgi:threonine dehydrogenase-like Zn-dependent dehydrogenase
MDVLHVATARAFGSAEFLTFDRNQARLASAEGLSAAQQIVNFQTRNPLTTKGRGEVLRLGFPKITTQGNRENGEV